MIGCFACIGLLLDIAGVALIWRYGLTRHVSPNSTNALSDEEVVRMLEEEGKLSPEYRNHRFLSRLGLTLLIVGFLLQLIGNCIDVRCC